MKIEAAGLYAGISSADYHGERIVDAPTLSHGGIVTLLQDSPMHAWRNHAKLNPKYREPQFDSQQRKRMDLGTAAHAMLLEPDQMSKRLTIVAADDWRTKDAQAKRAKAIAQGNVAILADDVEGLVPLVKTAAEYLAARGYYSTEGQAEMTIIWQEGAIWCRARGDMLIPKQRICIDYKLTQGSAKPEAVGKRIGEVGYDVQSQWYRRGLRAVTGQDWQFYLLTQEWNCADAISLVALDPTYEALGDDKCERGLMLWEKCLTNNIWPGYPAGLVHVGPAPYELTHWEESVQSGDGLSYDERVLLGTQA